MRVIIAEPNAEPRVVDTEQKYVLRAGHDLLGSDLYLQYVRLPGDYICVYDDDAIFTGKPFGWHGYYSTVMFAKLDGVDDNDYIITDIDDDFATRIYIAYSQRKMVL